MVFFRDAVDHICRAARIFSQPGGHMILVSSGPLVTYDYTHEIFFSQRIASILKTQLFLPMIMRKPFGLAIFTYETDSLIGHLNW